MVSAGAAESSSVGLGLQNNTTIYSNTTLVFTLLIIYHLSIQVCRQQCLIKVNIISDIRNTQGTFYMSIVLPVTLLPENITLLSYM